MPGLVLVDGSGDGDRLDWGGWPEWLAEAGSVVLRHDKPGCGGSPGHWTQQTLENRAHETLAALRVLRDHPRTAGQPVGLYGISQGGWVALLAAALEPDAVDFVVCHSGPGTTPAEQERDRIATWLRAEGHDDEALAEAMAWVDARFELMRDGTPPEAILAEQQRHADKPWFETTLVPYDSAEAIRFVSGMIDFDPRQVMPEVRCPVLVLFGADDTLVPAQTSLREYAVHLPSDVRHGYAVFPHANHGLFVADPVDGVDRRDQLAPAYLPTVTAFLADRRTG
ncbi:alpha/beta hydrolase [Ornithinimicrobium sp. F0845]|uniref:alpha/beta hydrolase family protein n=1 Tax=Ornithinimicrobium sp. F0845 TaxID=2926412 RepID=UPI001FF0E012|nr:alpha/beta hydrolase [Ornithinimicrobium sp. F0845]